MHQFWIPAGTCAIVDRNEHNKRRNELLPDFSRGVLVSSRPPSVDHDYGEVLELEILQRPPSSVGISTIFRSFLRPGSSGCWLRRMFRRTVIDHSGKGNGAIWKLEFVSFMFSSKLIFFFFFDFLKLCSSISIVFDCCMYYLK